MPRICNLICQLTHRSDGESADAKPDDWLLMSATDSSIWMMLTTYTVTQQLLTVRKTITVTDLQTLKAFLIKNSKSKRNAQVTLIHVRKSPIIIKWLL